MLAAAVHAFKGLFVLQADQTVLGGDLAHHLHGQQVVVDGYVGGIEDGSKLVLAGSNLVVLGLGGHAQLPQLLVQLLHERRNLGTDDAEVVLLQLLTLGRGSAEQGAAGKDQILTCLVVLFLDQEVLLLGADGGGNVVYVLAEQLQDADGLTGQCVHGTQQGSLFIQSLAGVADECSRNAQHVILHKGIAGGVPCGVAACLTGSAQTAGGEGGSIGLAAYQLLTGELHDGGTVAHRADEAIVLLAGDAGQGLEPVGVMGGTQLHCHLDIQRSTLVQGVLQALVGSAGQALLHNVLIKDLAAVDLHNICCHKSYSLLDLTFFFRLGSAAMQKPKACLHLNKNGAASQEVTHSAVAVYG